MLPTPLRRRSPSLLSTVCLNAPCLALSIPILLPLLKHQSTRALQTTASSSSTQLVSAAASRHLFNPTSPTPSPIRIHYRQQSFFSSHPHSHQSAIMSSKLIPSNPADVMVIRNVTPNVVTFSVPFARFGRIKIGGRGTLGMH